MVADRTVAAWAAPVALASGFLALIVVSPVLLTIPAMLVATATHGTIAVVAAAIVSAAAPACAAVALVHLAVMAWRWRTVAFVSRETRRSLRSISSWLIQAGILSAFIAPNLLAWIAGRSTPVVEFDGFVVWTLVLGVVAMVLARWVHRQVKARKAGAPASDSDPMAVD